MILEIFLWIVVLVMLGVAGFYAIRKNDKSMLAIVFPSFLALARIHRRSGN